MELKNNNAMKNGMIRVLVVVLSSLLLTMMAMLPLIPSTPAAADGPDDGVVVVQPETGQYQSKPISFTAPISGLTALQLTGLDVQATGGTICGIEGVGCTTADCFCACPPPFTDCQFWNYNFWDGSSWQSYSVGADSSTLNDNAIEGWAWGEFGTAPPAPPPTNQAQVVVQLGFEEESNIVGRQINFAGTLSGLEALQQTGLDVVTSNGAVCSIEGVGCPADNCFCACPPPFTDCKFWNYNFWDKSGGQWQAYQVGATGSTVSDGGIEGWAWGSGAPPTANPAAVSAAQDALAWLHRQQNSSTGGYSDLSDSVESLIAVTANGINPTDWTWYGSPSLLNYVLKSDTAGFANSDPAGFGKLAVALSAADACWPAGTNKMPAAFGTPGQYSILSGPQAWAMLGMTALSQTVPAAAVQVLKNQINSDGGWSWLSSTSSTSDLDGTAIALQALIASGEPVTATEVVSGLAYIKSLQMNDGGFINGNLTGEGSEGNANSTSYAVQAIVAAEQDPTSPTWTISGNTPISFLSGLQQADGKIFWQASNAGDIELATRQAVLALLRTPFPIDIEDLSTCSADVEVTKQAKVAFAGLGETITYTYHISNSGNVEVNLTAADDKLGAVNFGSAALAAGRSISKTLVHQVSLTDIGTVYLTNTVVVTGTPPTGTVDLATDLATVVMAVPVQMRHLAPFAADVSANDVEAQSSEVLIEVSNALQTKRLSGLKFGDSSSHFNLAALMSTVTLTPSIIPGLKTTVNVRPQPGVTQTIVLIGDNLNVDAPLDAMVLSGTTTTPPAGQGLVQIHHLAPFGANQSATAVDIGLSNAAGPVGAPFPLTGVQYKQSTGYLPLAAGTYTMTVTPNSGGSPLVQVFEVEAGDIGDIFVAGNGTNKALATHVTGVSDISGLSRTYLPLVIKE